MNYEQEEKLARQQQKKWWAVATGFADIFGLEMESESKA